MPATTIVFVSDPGTILALVLAVPIGLGVLLAVLSGLEDSLVPREPDVDGPLAQAAGDGSPRAVDLRSQP